MRFSSSCVGAEVPRPRDFAPGYGFLPKASRRSIVARAASKSSRLSRTTCAPADFIRSRADLEAPPELGAGQPGHLLGIQPQHVAGFGHSHRPDPGVPAGGDVRQCVSHRDDRTGRVHSQRLHAAPQHPGGRAPHGYLLGADSGLRDEPLGGQPGKDDLHHFPVVAGGDTYPHPVPAQRVHRLECAGDGPVELGQNLRLQWDELGVHRIEVSGVPRPAVNPAPFSLHRRQRQKLAQMILLVKTHGASGFIRADRYPASSEHRDKGPRGRTAAEIHAGAGQVEDDGFEFEAVA